MRRILDPLVLMGAQVLEQADGGRCPILLQGRQSRADRISHSRRLGADQIGGVVRWPQRAGPHHGDRNRGERDHTEKCCLVAPTCVGALWRAWKKNHARRRRNCARARSRFRSIRPPPPFRSRGPAGRRLGYHHRGHDDESPTHGLADHFARNGRADRDSGAPRGRRRGSRRFAGSLQRVDRGRCPAPARRR